MGWDNYRAHSARADLHIGLVPCLTIRSMRHVLRPSFSIWSGAALSVFTATANRSARLFRTKQMAFWWTMILISGCSTSLRWSTTPNYATGQLKMDDGEPCRSVSAMAETAAPCQLSPPQVFIAHSRAIARILGLPSLLGGSCSSLPGKTLQVTPEWSLDGD